MSQGVFGFGERLEGYPVPVLNERAVRASAGILLVGALVSYMNAWLVGNFQPTRIFVLVLVMAYLVVLKGVVGPVNILVCAACLTLMFFETAFGICIGCKVYQLVRREQAQLCPGGVCEVDPTQVPRLSGGQVGAFAAFILLAAAAGSWVTHNDPYAKARAVMEASEASPVIDPAEVERCTVPEFAKRIGHEAMWKLHNNCK